jgi:hypothetical protein
VDAPIILVQIRLAHQPTDVEKGKLPHVITFGVSIDRLGPLRRFYEIRI